MYIKALSEIKTSAFKNQLDAVAAGLLHLKENTPQQSA
mgnify:CR=1 FL=1|tara:strand:+ start:110 stop:223 length:114 start_codon:yes stop_codon:yes gene_type:complete